MNTLSSLLKNLRNRTPVGTIQMYGGAAAPTDWLICDGSAVSRTDYAALFAVLGTTYGEGNGTTTFNLPDFQDNFPVGAGDSYSLNDKGGADTVKLTNQEMAHHHAFTQPSIYGGACMSSMPTRTLTGTISARKMQGGVQSLFPSGASAILSYKEGPSKWADAAFGTSTSNFDSVEIDATHQHPVPSHSHTAIGGAVTDLHGANSTRTAHENRPPYIGINFIIYAGRTA